MPTAAAGAFAGRDTLDVLLQAKGGVDVGINAQARQRGAMLLEHIGEEHGNAMTEHDRIGDLCRQHSPRSLGRPSRAQVEQTPISAELKERVRADIASDFASSDKK